MSAAKDRFGGDEMRRLFALAPFLAAALIAGCGSSSSSTSSKASSAPASSSSAPASAPASSGGGASGQLTLGESEFKITPASPTVAHTGTITITVKNTGAVTHALTVDTPSGPVSTGSIAPGATTTLKVNATKAGRYTFFCPIDGHRAAGMQGVLVVGGAGASTGASGAASSSGGSSGSGAPSGGSGY
jgi:uncharacterized cupredoxin-like copper-binding protein